MSETLVFEPIPGLPDWRTAHVPSTGSTNADLAALVRDGRAGEGRLWLTAGEQTQGRGRRGRPWSSPPGNFFGSLALIDPAPGDRIGFLPLVTALAVRDAVAAELGEAAPAVDLKWPNDVLIDGAKCCGILLESLSAPDGANAVIIGCGINVTAHPLDTPYPATHLQAHRPDATSHSLFHHLVGAFAAIFGDWNRGRNTSSIRERWLGHARGRGDRLTVTLDNASHQGIFEDIDADGYLILRLPDGTSKEFAAGDVFFKPQGRQPSPAPLGGKGTS
ncbi:MAG: biotin--[acetyl-CoA-carboxylase] ligase [Roseitalea sp.]|jgi:BirA family biotin operon repressor/biotin-[acetyl-CoA-carboxylase] ligase|nr:biotin--[acetyl-CoA-carboxylase] ligase [Roseitalea sp.]MBO6741299.1 biotin--[acetyl-CoA-carboxylase] ligase [Roseitalea sp.]